MKPDRADIVYDGDLVRVVVEQWGASRREIVEHPGAVAIVAVDDDGFVVLVEQRREATRGTLLELPAGTVDEGEEPQETARRELREETGLTGGTWRRLGGFWTSPGFVREYLHVFLAEGVRPGAAAPDEDEQVELVRLPFEEAVARTSELEDAKTVAGLLLAAAARS